ncbi:MAG: TIGR01212 family radical SAM protein [Spirochaetota bacterium]
MLEHTPPAFNSYSGYLQRRHGGRTYRVAVDGGFSCPNRPAGRDSEGCSFCDSRGGRATYTAATETVREQVERGVAFLTRRYDAKYFALYFQAFTSTFGTPEELRAVYDAGLSAYPFRELVVSTRPDAVDRPRARLLASYQTDDRDVWVELGLQTAHDATLQEIRRGHTVADFLRAYEMLREEGLHIGVHVINGLPGEGLREIEETAAFVAGLRPDGVKIHNLHISRDTALYREYLAGNMSLPAPHRQLEYAVRFIELLPPETVIMRVSCDTPRDSRALPRRVVPKQQLYAALTEELERRGSRQGKYYTAA